MRRRSLSVGTDKQQEPSGTTTYVPTGVLLLRQLLGDALNVILCTQRPLPSVKHSG
jgi:hypothetical protein